MKLKFTSEFKFAHGGTHIEVFQPEQVVENPSPRLYKVAIDEKAAIDPEQENSDTEKASLKSVKPSKESKTKA